MEGEKGEKKVGEMMRKNGISVEEDEKDNVKGKK